MWLQGSSSCFQAVAKPPFQTQLHHSLLRLISCISLQITVLRALPAELCSGASSAHTALFKRKIHLQLPKVWACSQELPLVVFVFLSSILAPQSRAEPSNTGNGFLFSSEKKKQRSAAQKHSSQRARSPTQVNSHDGPEEHQKNKGYKVLSLRKRQYLRRNDFFPTHKFCVGDCLAMPFEHHDWLLSVAKIVVVNTVIWR